MIKTCETAYEFAQEHNFELKFITSYSLNQHLGPISGVIPQELKH